VLANVNRWRKDQLGLKEVRDADLATLGREIQVNDVKAMLVDMVGQGLGKKPPLPSLPPPAPGDKAPFRYTTPEGWKETAPNFIELAAFRTGSDADAPKCTV